MLFSGLATIHERVLMYLIIALTILEFTTDLNVEFDRSFGHPGLVLR
jgi:hypothetical protein